MMIGDETRAIELVETVRKEIAMYNAQGKNKFVIDMSVGCQIVLCTDELSIPMVLEKADKIMYEEKKIMFYLALVYSSPGHSFTCCRFYRCPGSIRQQYFHRMENLRWKKILL